ncbi:MAG: hypothetical protein ACRER2_11455 [Methylococcales bacterium]
MTQDIEFLLDDLATDGFVWILLLDEFEWLIRTDHENEALTRDLLGGLRGLMNHASRVLSLIVATRQPLHEICREIRFMGSPFYNSFVYVHLRPFKPDEAESLIQQMLEGSHVHFTEDDKAFLHELAGLQPLLLQAAAFCLFNAKAGAPANPKSWTAARIRRSTCNSSGRAPLRLENRRLVARHASTPD